MGFADFSMDFSGIADFEPVFKKVEKKVPNIQDAIQFSGIKPDLKMLNRKTRYKTEWAVFSAFPELTVYYRQLTSLNKRLKMECGSNGCEKADSAKSRFLPVKEYQVTSSDPNRCVLCYRPIPTFENVYMEILRLREFFNKIFLILEIQPSDEILISLVRRATSHPLLKCFDFEDDVVHLCKNHFNTSCDIDDYGFVKESYTISFNSQLFLITYEMMMNEMIETRLQESVLPHDDQTESECQSDDVTMSEDMDENADTQSEFSIEEIPLPQIDTIPMPSPSSLNIPMPSADSSIASTILNTSSDMEISDEE